MSLNSRNCFLRFSLPRSVALCAGLQLTKKATTFVSKVVAEVLQKLWAVPDIPLCLRSMKCNNFTNLNLAT